MRRIGLLAGVCALLAACAPADAKEPVSVRWETLLPPAGSPVTRQITALPECRRPRLACVDQIMPPAETPGRPLRLRPPRDLRSQLPTADDDAARLPRATGLLHRPPVPDPRGRALRPLLPGGDAHLGPRRARGAWRVAGRAGGVAPGRHQRRAGPA